MKRQLCIYILFLLLAACTADPDWQHIDCTTTETVATSRHEAHITLVWDKESAGLVTDVVVEYALDEHFTNSQQSGMAKNNGGWEAAISGLQDDRIYHIRYHVTPAYLQPQQAVSSFRTVNPDTPSVQTKAATDITATAVVLHGIVSVYDNYEITERGFYYSLLKTGDYERKQIKCGKGEGGFEAAITALRADATYYFVAYAINKNGIAYGDTLQFSTLNPYK